MIPSTVENSLDTWLKPAYNLASSFEAITANRRNEFRLRSVRASAAQLPPAKCAEGEAGDRETDAKLARPQGGVSGALSGPLKNGVEGEVVRRMKDRAGPNARGGKTQPCQKDGQSDQRAREANHLEGKKQTRAVSEK